MESRDAMAYRSGLMRREQIEDALKAGDIRGLASTSAMELGIDIPDLQVGFNLGLPHPVGRIRQRAGRVGRTGPARFIIVAPRHAFQFHEDSLQTYWHQPVEPARLYPSNPNIKNTPRPLPGQGDRSQRHGAGYPITHGRLAGTAAPDAAGDRPGRSLRAGVPDRGPATAPTAMTSGTPPTGEPASCS